MKREDERSLAGLTVRIDRTLCVGFGDCIDVLPGTFELDEEGIATFRDAVPPSADQLLEACQSCPVDALTLLDGTGRQLAP